MHALIESIPNAVTHFERRRAEITAERASVHALFSVHELHEINARWHYAKAKYRSPFDLYWDGTKRVIYLRIAVGRRRLGIPVTARHVGRYDRTAQWEDVKADLVAVAQEAR